MSKKEPDGYAEISPEGEFTGTEQEIYIKREKPSDTHVQNVESMGYQVIPVWLSDTPPVSKEVLEKLKVYLWKHAEGIHYYCEDSWCSCPAHPEGCANEALGEKCNCGAEDKAQEAADLLVELNLLPEEQPK